MRAINNKAILLTVVICVFLCAAGCSQPVNDLVHKDNSNGESSASSVKSSSKTKSSDLRDFLPERFAGKDDGFGLNMDELALFSYSQSVWPNNGESIHVSWENPSPDNEEGRRWVQAAIERTWQAESGVSFVGWDAAKAGTRGVRILIIDEDDAPHVEGLGRALDGKPNGMKLNFTFKKWCPQCLSGRTIKSAIEDIAIHEFGHALGFAHEHNRPDAPPLCAKERQGTDGDTKVTVYDPNSIMNYCNEKWNNAGQLSEWDIYGVRQIYGLPSRMLAWKPTDLTVNYQGVLAVGEPFGYEFDVQGNQHIFYRGENGHINEFYGGLGTWNHGDITLGSNSPPAAGEPHAFKYDKQGNQHVIYRDGGGNIHEIYGGLGKWHHNPLTQRWGGPEASSDPCGVEFHKQGNQHIFYNGKDGHVHEMYFDPGDGVAKWYHNDLTLNYGGTSAVGKLCAYEFSVQQNLHVFYRGVNGHICEFVGEGGRWTHIDITEIAKGDAVPHSVGELSAYVFPFQGNQHVIFRSADGHVHELYGGVGEWHHSDLTRATGSPIAASDPRGYSFSAQANQHVVYRGHDDQIYEIYGGVGKWHYGKLSGYSTGSLPVGNLCGYEFRRQSTQHIIYRGKDNHIHELHY